MSTNRILMCKYIIFYANLIIMLPHLNKNTTKPLPIEESSVYHSLRQLPILSRGIGIGIL